MKIERPQHICNNCKHLARRWDNNVKCRMSWWEGNDDEGPSSIEDFLWKAISDNKCEDFSAKSLKWSQGIPTDDGWYWVWNGNERLIVIVRTGILYLNEARDKPGYPLSGYTENDGLWWMPCKPPPIPR